MEIVLPELKPITLVAGASSPAQSAHMESMNSSIVQNNMNNMNTMGGGKKRKVYGGGVTNKVIEVPMSNNISQDMVEVTKNGAELYANAVTLSEHDKTGGAKKAKKHITSKNFKKHYMWNTKGKKYLAKTYKQHMKGVKLGHTHSKPKSQKIKRKSKKGKYYKR